MIDVQSLLPFDIHGMIVESLKKTNRVLFVDEDMPGGTTAYMMQEVIEKQGGYFHLDSPARTLSAKAHRPAYGSDGDYWSKPNAETIFDEIYAMMNEVDPSVSIPEIINYKEYEVTQRLSLVFLRGEKKEKLWRQKF